MIKSTEEASGCIESLLGNIGRVWRIDERDFDFASTFTSCGPGLFAAIFQELVETGLRYTNSFGKEEITEMILQTLHGTSRLMLEKKLGFRDVILRVATKGGITEEGVKVIGKGLPRVFDEMLGQCMNKRKAISEKVSYEFRDICK
ncbi:MAG: pyrroline-5-carboxylate reductase dimerization domain-containing protein [Acetivibrionales bacterium]|jgi:pyrroline-5-carboxylate reductase